jgi:hypothetical protein
MRRLLLSISLSLFLVAAVANAPDAVTQKKMLESIAASQKAGGRPAVRAPQKAGMTGVLTYEWSFEFPDYSDHLMFGSSPAVGDAGINNVVSPGEVDADLEIFTGTDAYVGTSDPACLARFYLLDSRGAEEWSKCTQSDEPGSSAVFADLNGDCLFEMGGGTTSGRNLEIMTRDGAFSWYWPSTLHDGYDYCDYWQSSVAAADLIPSNPGLEVIGGRNDGYVRVFSGTDGTLLWERPVAIPDFCWGEDQPGYVVSSVAIGNIDGSADGSLEIVVGTNDNKVVALDAAGNTLWEFPTMGHVNSSAALADLDNDGKLEIVIGCDDGKVYLLQGDDNGDGTISPTEFTSYTTGGMVRSSAAIGDLDGDGTLDIVIGSSDLNVYAFDYDPASNALVVKWTFATDDEVISSPALADRDGSGTLDVFVGTGWGGFSGRGVLYLLDGSTGAMIDFYDAGGPIPTSPAVADIDGDGKLEVLVNSWDGVGHPLETLYAIEDSASSVTPRRIEWGQFRHDHMHTGRYGVAYPYLDPSCAASGLCCSAGCYGPIECEGETTQVTLDGSGCSGATSWSWQGSFDESIASGPSVTATFHGTGSFIVALTISDGESERTCTTDVNIQDTTPPVAECPGPQTLPVDGNCRAVYQGTVAAEDVCGAVTTGSIPPVPATFEGVGEHSVTLTAVDESGNLSVCQASVTLEDTMPPVLACPEGVVLVAGPGCQARYDAMPEAADNCCVEGISSVPAVPGDFGPGPHTITYTATDGSGNTASCATQISVEDRTPPQITCPAPVVLQVNGQCEAQVNLQASATDNCSAVAITSNPPLPAMLAGLGPHTIVFAASDASGNRATCETTATLVDVTPPVLDCPQSVTLEVGSQCAAHFGDRPTATDNCCVQSVSAAPALPADFGPGSYSIGYTATDGSGNTASCQTAVNVVDASPPVVTCPPPITLLVNGQCGVVYALEAAGIDNCGTVSIASVPPVPAPLSGLGPRSIVFTATDAAGNTASCTALADLKDEITPGVLCPPEVTVEADATCQADVPIAALASDNCPPPDLLTCPAGPYKLGRTEIAVHAIDGSGNRNLCETAVTVVDTTAPAVNCELLPVTDDEDEVQDEEADEAGDSGVVSTDHYRIVFSGTDNCGESCCEATLNDIPVTDGQVVILKLKKKFKFGIEYEDHQTNSIFVFEGPSFVLEVRCTDCNGNSAECTAMVGEDTDEMPDAPPAR